MAHLKVEGSASPGRLLGGLMVLLALLLGQTTVPPADAASSDAPCRPVLHEGSEFVVCTADLRQHQVRLFWKSSDGQPLGSFDQLRQTPLGSRVIFAMNGGMYHEDRSPVGLYVENGQELKRANTANGPGNFHLKPNGVFFVKGDTAGVMETSRYLKQRPRPDFATQSGPMLVINGQIHPKISEEGPSRKIRNGVGMRDRHTAVFAISSGPVTFGAFARLFRDELGCENALFLDGSVSSLYAPSLNRSDGLLPMGPMIGALRQ